MKNDRVLDGQINFNNELDVNYKEVNKSINFFKLLPVNSIRQYSLIKEMSIEELFHNHNLLLLNDDENQIFEKVDMDDRYIFLKYGNKTNIDATLQNIYKDGEKVSPIDLILENFTFIVIDYKELKLAVIKNKNTSNWEKSLRMVLQKYKIDYVMVPFKDEEILEDLKDRKLKSIEFTTASKDKINEYCKFNQLDNRAEFEGLVISQVTQKVTIKEYQPKKAREVIENQFLNEQNQYSTIKLDFGDKICDLIEKTITLSIKIPIPENLDANSASLYRLKEIMISNLKQYT